MTAPDPVLPAPRRTRRWVDDYARALILVDLAALLVAAMLALLVRFGSTLNAELRGSVSYLLVGLVLALLWLAVLAVSRCYETRFLGGGPEELRRVANASVRVTAAVALIAFSLKLELARGFVFAFLVLGTGLLLLGRSAARAYVRRGRRSGRRCGRAAAG
ncbi:MAG TPA: hypothetical protein VNU26_02250, partial [Mycobacteriales bacterium]|nr:hypothetical protein [Mycobacteriales bacterium]